MAKKLLVNKRGVLLTLAGLVVAGAASVTPFDKVFASSATLSVSSSSVNVGDSFTATVNMTDAAAWNIHVTASGPVDGCTIAVADATSDAMNASRSFGANCTATGEGTITLTLSGDITGEDMSNTPLSGSASVSVSAPAPQPEPQPAPQPEQPSSESSSESESSAGNGESSNGSAGGETSGDSGSSSDSSTNKTDSEASNSSNESKASSSTKATGTDKKNLTRAAENTKVGDDNSQDEQPNLIWIPFACVGGMIVLIGIGFGIYYFINKRSLKKPLNRGGRK